MKLKKEGIGNDDSSVDENKKMATVAHLVHRRDIKRCWQHILRWATLAAILQRI